MIELCSMENLNALSDGIFTISGVIIGAIFTFITQMIVSHFSSKNEHKKQIREQKMKIYPKALKYIVSYERIIKVINDNTAERTYKLEKSNEEATLYDDFFFEFEAIAPREIVNKFNELRDGICEGNITSQDAHKVLQQVFHSDLNDYSNTKRYGKFKIICCSCCKTEKDIK